MIEIELRARNGAVRAITTVDDEDSDLANVRWYFDSNGKRGYARRSILVGKRTNEDGATKNVFRRTSVHREVLERKLGRPIGPRMVPDHINGNSLDNRRCNLREASCSDNMSNRTGADAKGRSGYRNVSLNSETGRYFAAVVFKGKSHFGGMYDTAEEAAWAAHGLRESLGMPHDATPLPPHPTTFTPKHDGRNLNKNNTSGYRGVTWSARSKKWVAQVAYGGRGGKTKYVGLFDTPEAAAAAAAAARKAIFPPR